jgi:Zn-dependent protease
MAPITRDRTNAHVRSSTHGSGSHTTQPPGRITFPWYDRRVIFTVLNEFQDNPAALLAFLAAWAVAMVTGLAFHEFCHAWSAYQLGDDYAARQGRLSLNPLRHLDPMGSILLLVVGIGWAKPTPVIPSRLRYGPVRGGAIVSAAGPLSNFVIAAIAALPLKAGWIDSVGSFGDIGSASAMETLGLFLQFIIFLNVILGVFNLIPIPPLDGFDVIQPILPREVRAMLAPMRQWGFGILMILFILPFATGGAINPLGDTIRTLSDFVFRIVA